MKNGHRVQRYVRHRPAEVSEAGGDDIWEAGRGTRLKVGENGGDDIWRGGMRG